MRPVLVPLGPSEIRSGLGPELVHVPNLISVVDSNYYFVTTRETPVLNLYTTD